MRKRMIILLFLLALALGICMVTNVLSLFPGTHTLIDMSSDANDINCTGCHSEIQKQLSNSSIHSDFDCEGCHRFGGTGIVFAARTQSGYQIGDQAHAAYTPRCLDCHGEGGYATQATAFNESGYGSKASAHRPLVVLALDCNLSVGENEACLACHTNYSIKFEFMRPEYFNFTLEFDHMNIEFTIHEIAGPNTTTISKSDSGAKHEFKAINQIKCEDCHSDVWQAANHTELNENGVPYASHVCWMWAKSGGGGMNGMVKKMVFTTNPIEVPGTSIFSTSECGSAFTCSSITVCTFRSILFKRLSKSSISTLVSAIFLSTGSNRVYTPSSNAEFTRLS
ncbi:hypothetical protein ES705_23892 [subsurface metagenome]|nr:hypothetical protein [Methanosarcinales archaeon]